MADHTEITDHRSAGVVLFRENVFGLREYLLLDYGRHWDFPKGHLEAAEDDRAAALRELFEETGIRDVAIDESFARRVRYFFRDRGKLVRKEVVFLLGSTTADQVRLSPEHAGYAWLTYEDALNCLTFASARDVIRRAEGHLQGS